MSDKKFLFSIIASGDTEQEALARLQNLNIKPDDMDIKEILDYEKSWTVIGFYSSDNQKYTGHFNTETAQEAEEGAENLGVTVCGVIKGTHNTVDKKKYLK